MNHSERFIETLFGKLCPELPLTVIHGYEEGFGGEISDIDMALPRGRFREFLELTAAHAAACDWVMCQVLQHETTAWYVVCCRREDPRCFVALDVCTDYRVRGHLVLTADELLEGRERAKWGGWQSGPVAKLCYCVAKAAAKQKPVEAILDRVELLDLAGDEVKCWLTEKWELSIEGWSAGELTQILKVLCGRLAKTRWSIEEMKRVLARVTGGNGFQWYGSEAERGIFMGIFRREEGAAGASASSFVKGLLGSTLWVGGKKRLWTTLIGGGCAGSSEVVLKALEQRTVRRWLEN